METKKITQEMLDDIKTLPDGKYMISGEIVKIIGGKIVEVLE